MRCNLFKTIGAGDKRMGTFLMFAQYTEDITKEQTMKSNYRVVPSKFVAINLDIDNVIKSNHYISANISGDSMTIGTATVEGIDNIIPQLFQSYYENGYTFARNNPEKIPGGEWNIENRSFASEMLWRMFEECGFIKSPQTYSDDSGSFKYYDEIKYIGDINIHSNHTVGSYSYDEVFCHIPAKADEYFYQLDSLEKEGILYHEEIEGGNLDSPLEEWNDATYPFEDPVKNRTITYHNPNDDLGYYYNIGGDIPILNWVDRKPVPRHQETIENAEYKFNAIILFYDVICSEPGEDPQYIHRGRPMGIYLSGPSDNSGETITLKNTFTKYIANNDAYGQGASFGLRIMSRYTPTPNMTNQVIEVEENGDDYETMTQAMGSIADAVIDINRLCKDQKAMYQTFKDHLAQFRNRRVNVPYPREVNGRMYWFVNGRNTGQPCQADVPTPTPTTQDVDVDEYPEGGEVQITQEVDINL